MADQRIVETINENFVPVAIDQWYERRLDDDAGEFYRTIARQGPRNDFQRTTQGFYLATADGQLLNYGNSRNRDRMQQQIRQALARFDADQTITPDRNEISDVRPSMPPGTVVARVNSRVLDGYAKVRSPQHQIMQQSIGRDHLWITVDEQAALVNGSFPDSLSRKIARFHLIDNTRGEPPMWEVGEVRQIAIRMDEQGAIHGDVRLATDDGQRGFEGTIHGKVESADNQLVQFDLLARGLFWGEGKYTRSAPAGKFPFAVAIRLAPGDRIADQVLPQAIKGWHRQYMNP